MDEQWENLKAQAESAFAGGQFAKSERIWRLALEESVLSESPLKGCICLEGLGSCFFSLGRYSEAEEQYMSCLEIRTELLGDDHPDVVHTLDSLSASLSAQGKFAEAEAFLTLALSILSRLKGSYANEIRWHVKTLTSLYDKMKIVFDSPLQNGFRQFETLEKEPDKQTRTPICPSCNRPYNGRECTNCTALRINAYASEPAEKQVLISVVSARKDIRLGTLIGLDAVEVSKRLVPQNMYLSDIDQALGMAATRLISEGQMLKITDVEREAAQQFGGPFQTGEYDVLGDPRRNSGQFHPVRRSW
jgi:tetratricopeptide (TPR) repeat protein